MVLLPLAKRLRKQVHKDIAIAQDIIVNEIYNYFDKAVIHGGTAIWRCYGGTRFSEDIDVYLPLSFKKSWKIKNFVKSLESKDFIIKKFREKENSIYAKFLFGNSIVSFEAVFKSANPVVKPFELSDGNFLNVYTLSAENFIKEKTNAYISRRKTRDLYDIFFLLNFVENKQDIKLSLSNLMKNFREPVDAEYLKALIIAGAVPKISDIIEAIKRWAK